MKKKVNFKSKKVVSGIFAVLFLSFGLTPMGAPVATEVACQIIECEA